MFTELVESQETHILRFGGKLANMTFPKRARFKAHLVVKQGFKCHYCKCSMTLDNSKRSKNQATFEHLFDVFEGGGKKIDEVDKIVIACKACNDTRGTAREARARRYYSKFFARKDTFRRFLVHPKVGWIGIMREFGKIPSDFI